MRVFLLCCMWGFTGGHSAGKERQSSPKQATPSASSTLPAPEQPWLQMEITPLEQEIVKQHLVDIRAAQSKKSGPDKALPPGSPKKWRGVKSSRPAWQKNCPR